MDKVGEINLLRGKKGRKRSDGNGRDEGRDSTRDIADFVRLRKDDTSRLRRERAERAMERASSADDTRQRIALQREEADRQREIDAFWRRFLRKLPRPRKPGHGADTGTKRSTNGAARRSHRLPAYTKQLIDRLGRRGIYLALRYLSATSADRGVARRLVRYAFKRDHVEFDEFLEKQYVSNVGEDEHEIASGFDLLEDANRAARRNAKVVYHMIVQLPHDLSPQQRLEIIRQYCELRFGSHDLPYLAVLHEPSAEGDQRNFHGHILFAFRPMVRRAPYEWDVGQSLRRDLDNPQSMQAMRTDFAAVMTKAMQAAGKNVEYTGLSHAARGLKCRPTEHLGAQKTRDVRDRQYVAANARNARRIVINEAILEVERLDREREEIMSALAALPRTVRSPLRAARPARLGVTRIRSVRRRDPARYRTNKIATATMMVAARPKPAQEQAAAFALRPPATEIAVDQAVAAAISVRTLPAIGSKTAPLPTLSSRPNRFADSQSFEAIAPIGPIEQVRDRVRPAHPVAALPIGVDRPTQLIAKVGMMDPAVTSSNVPSLITPPVGRRGDGQEPERVVQVSMSASVRREHGHVFTEPLHVKHADRPTSRTGERVVPLATMTSDRANAAASAADAPTPAQRPAGSGRLPVAFPAKCLDRAQQPTVPRDPKLKVTERRKVPVSQRLTQSVRPSRGSLQRPPTEALELRPAVSAVHDAKAELRRKEAEKAETQRKREEELAEQREEERRRSAIAQLPPIIPSTASAQPKRSGLRLDGFGGMITDPAPDHQVPNRPLRPIEPFDAEEEPTPELLATLAAARKHASSIHFASDGRLTTDDDAPDSLRDAVHGWRHDGDVALLLRDVVKRARGGSERPWPREIESKMLAFLRTNPSADLDRGSAKSRRQNTSLER